MISYPTLRKNKAEVELRRKQAELMEVEKTFEKAQEARDKQKKAYEENVAALFEKAEKAKKK